MLTVSNNSRNLFSMARMCSVLCITKHSYTSIPNSKPALSELNACFEKANEPPSAKIINNFDNPKPLDGVKSFEVIDRDKLLVYVKSLEDKISKLESQRKEEEEESIGSTPIRDIVKFVIKGGVTGFSIFVFFINFPATTLLLATLGIVIYGFT